MKKTLLTKLGMITSPLFVVATTVSCSVFDTSIPEDKTKTKLVADISSITNTPIPEDDFMSFDTSGYKSVNSSLVSNLVAPYLGIENFTDEKYNVTVNKTSNLSYLTFLIDGGNAIKIYPDVFGDAENFVEKELLSRLSFGTILSEEEFHDVIGDNLKLTSSDNMYKTLGFIADFYSVFTDDISISITPSKTDNDAFTNYNFVLSLDEQIIADVIFEKDGRFIQNENMAKLEYALTRTSKTNNVFQRTEIKSNTGDGFDELNAENIASLGLDLNLASSNGNILENRTDISNEFNWNGEEYKIEIRKNNDTIGVEYRITSDSNDVVEDVIYIDEFEVVYSSGAN